MPRLLPTASIAVSGSVHSANRSVVTCAPPPRMPERIATVVRIAPVRASSPPRSRAAVRNSPPRAIRSSVSRSVGLRGWEATHGRRAERSAYPDASGRDLHDARRGAGGGPRGARGRRGRSVPYGYRLRLATQQPSHLLLQHHVVRDLDDVSADDHDVSANDDDGAGDDDDGSRDHDD